MKHFLLVLCLFLPFFACGDDDGLYSSCDSAGDCEAPEGQQAACVEKEGEGFCSWACDSDTDCADDSSELVCASFEDTSGKFCFPACGANQGCPGGFECRSTGGGVNNRMVCFP